MYLQGEKVLRAILELGPIVFAVIAILIASKNFKFHKENGRALISSLSIVCSFLLIFAQSSWYVLVVVLNSLEDSVLSNLVWTVFNVLIMLLLILVNKK